MHSRNRVDERVSAALKVTVAGAAGEPCVTRNISLGGVFLLVKQRWPEGTVLKLELRDRFHSVSLFARAVRHERDGVAFAFVEVSEAQRQRLHLLIDGLLADGAWYDDRRRSVRTALTGPVVWRYGDREFQAELRDLSDGGALIGTTQPPELGAQILLYLPALGDDAAAEAGVLGCQALVAHRTPEGFGVTFLFPSPEFSTTVERLVRSAGL